MTTTRKVGESRVHSVTIGGHTFPYPAILALRGAVSGRLRQHVVTQMRGTRGLAERRVDAAVRIGLLRVDGARLHLTALGLAHVMSPAMANALRTVVNADGPVFHQFAHVPGKSIQRRHFKWLKTAGLVQVADGVSHCEATAAGRTVLNMYDEVWHADGADSAGPG